MFLSAIDGVAAGLTFSIPYPWIWRSLLGFTFLAGPILVGGSGNISYNTNVDGTGIRALQLCRLSVEGYTPSPFNFVSSYASEGVNPFLTEYFSPNTLLFDGQLSISRTPFLIWSFYPALSPDAPTEYVFGTNAYSNSIVLFPYNP